MPKCSKVEAKMGSKIDVNFERRFFENHCFSKGKIRFFEIQEVKVGSKTRSKINIKSDAETGRLGNPILIDF